MEVVYKNKNSYKKVLDIIRILVYNLSDETRKKQKQWTPNS